MSACRDTGYLQERGPKGGSWETRPPDHEPVQWELDSDSGVVQGPLDLDFFAGRRLLLRLEPGQVALLIDDGNVRTVYLEGRHTILVGTGAGTVPPGCELVFLAIDRPLSVTWDERQALWLPDGSGRAVRIPISGGCSCRIADATRFFDAFLRFGDGSGEAFALQIIDCLIRSRIEESTAKRCGADESTPDSPREYIDSLQPADMDPGLDQLGLVCTSLSVHLPDPRSADGRLASGQSAGMGFNSPH